MIAIFRDVGAPARLTRLVEGEALLNDAAAISLFVVLLEMILSEHQPDALAGLREFTVSFVGGGVVGFFAGRLLLWIISRVGDDRLAEATLTLAFAYLHLSPRNVCFTRREWCLCWRRVHVDCHRAGPDRSRKLDFLAANLGTNRILGTLFDLYPSSILAQPPLGDFGLRDLFLLLVLIAAASGARFFLAVCALPLLEWLKLTQRIDASYKFVIIWEECAVR